VIKLADDLRGDEALRYMPRGVKAPEAVLISATELSGVDSWTGTVTKTIIEFHSRWQQRPIRLEPPQDPATWSMLAAMIGTDLPVGFDLAGRKSWPPDPSRKVTLPAQRISSLDVVDKLAEAIEERLTLNYPNKLAGYLGSAFGSVAENAVVHGAGSPTDPLGAVSYDAEMNELSLVVSDLGPGISGEADPVVALEELIPGRRPLSGLSSIASEAERKDIDVSLTVAAGHARRFWRRGGTWSSFEEDFSSRGFTVGVRIHI
jgi:hypothetical protein